MSKDYHVSKMKTLFACNHIITFSSLFILLSHFPAPFRPPPHPILASPPQQPPPFTAPFEGVKRLTCSPVLHRVIQCVLKQSAIMSETRVLSDKLLHEVLFLCGLMFLEEEPTESTSLCKAAIGQYGGKCVVQWRIGIR